jgi:ABC-type transport system substrate-binding protein
MAIDQKAIADTIFGGQGWNTTTLVLPDFDWNLPDQEYRDRWFKRDVAAARQMLRAAGVPEGFELEMVHLQLVPDWTTAGELVIAQLKEIGINARLRPVDAAGWNEQQAGRGEYLAYHGPPQPQASASADLRIRFRSGGSRNSSRITDARLDEMIDRQATLVRDVEGRKRLLQDIQRHLLEQGYIIPTWGSQVLSARWPWVKNYRLLNQPSNEPDIFAYTWIDK